MRLKWGLAALLLAANAGAAGHLDVERAWIRTAPPGAMMLAGYATLRNTGDAPVTVVGAVSKDFGDVSLHESVEQNGVERMRALGAFKLAPGASADFAPSGKHFMLMRPRRGLVVGDKVTIHIATDSDAGVDADFVVRDAAP